jgi:hypothetical protein
MFGMDDKLKVAPKGIDKGHKYVLSLPLFIHVGWESDNWYL